MSVRKRLDWGDETFEDDDGAVADRYGCKVSTVRTERRRRGISHLVRGPDIDFSKETFDDLVENAASSASAATSHIDWTSWSRPRR
jgi:hypothetical protein